MKVINYLILVAVILAYPGFAFASSTEIPLEQINLDSQGVAVHGNDVVSYFKGEAKSGSVQYESNVNGARYRFGSAENKESFLDNPERYQPQYGGWCATAMAMDMKLDIDPQSYKVAGNQLYLFSKVNGVDAREMWNKDEANLKAAADKNWFRRIKPKGDKKFYNLMQGDVGVRGYDLVSYRKGQPVAGSTQFETEYRGVHYLFASAENKSKFLADPEAFLPEFGGWCATATAMGMWLDIDPLKYMITDGRLFLFSNVDGKDARQMWLMDETNLTGKADSNWVSRISSY